MIKILLGFAAVVVLVIAGVRVFGSPSRERAACEHVYDRCNGLMSTPASRADVDECTSRLQEAPKIVGEQAASAMLDCFTDSNTCAEIRGCLRGVGESFDPEKPGYDRARHRH